MAGRGKSLGPARPAPSDARHPQQMGPSIRILSGVPVTTLQPATKPGGHYDERVSDSGNK